MSHNQDEKLVYMANQIGKFFASQGDKEAVAGVATHIQKFWDPRMRDAIYAYVDRGGSGLASNVRDAIQRLRASGA